MCLTTQARIKIRELELPEPICVLPAGLTCLKEVAAAMPRALFNSLTSCQAFRASHRLIKPGEPLTTERGPWQKYQQESKWRNFNDKMFLVSCISMGNSLVFGLTSQLWAHVTSSKSQNPKNWADQLICCLMLAYLWGEGWGAGYRAGRGLGEGSCHSAEAAGRPHGCTVPGSNLIWRHHTAPCVWRPERKQQHHHLMWIKAGT